MTQPLGHIQRPKESQKLEQKLMYLKKSFEPDLYIKKKDHSHLIDEENEAQID